ncbi:MAG: pectate lyase-like adhesive domain-containing protein [Lachnospiraceae bacterium]
MRSFDKHFGLFGKILLFLLVLTMIMLQIKVHAQEFETDIIENQYTTNEESQIESDTNTEESQIESDTNTEELQIQPDINESEIPQNDEQGTVDGDTEMLQPHSVMLDANTIIVENEAEFRNALANAQYNTIYLGADITLSSRSNSNIVVSRTAPLVIDGTDPREGGTRHTYTDYYDSAHDYTLGGQCADITFKNMDVYLRNHYGIYYPQNNNVTTVTFDNVTGSARQFYHGAGRNTILVINNSDLYLTNTGIGTPEDFAENTTEIRFAENVTITRTMSSAYYYFRNVPTVTIEDGANVVLDNSINKSGPIFNDVDNFIVGAGATFACYSGKAFCVASTTATLNNVTIGEKADVRFIYTAELHTHNSLFGVNNSTFTAGPGSKFLLYDNESDSDWGAFWFANITLDNVESFIILNTSDRAIGNRTNANKLTINGVSSVRYYPSNQISDLFNTNTYAYTPTRKPHNWWANTSLFGVAAAGWSSSDSPTITDNTYSSDNIPLNSITVQTALTPGNFGIRNVADANAYGVEIYNSIYTVTYTGNGENSGTVPEGDAGVPNDFITIKDNTGSLARYGYTFGGWNTSADGTGKTYQPDEPFIFTNNTTLYAQWVPDKYTVSGTLIDIPELSGQPVSYTLNGGDANIVYTDSNGSYTITVPHGTNVIITPPAQNGYNVKPESIPIMDISTGSTGNDFVYTPYTVTEKYVDDLTGGSFGRDDTFAEYTTSPYDYEYDGSLADIIENNDTYKYIGYKFGSYNPGDMLDGSGKPEANNLSSDAAVYLIYHKISKVIDVTFPTGSNWSFYVNQDTYPNVETGAMDSSNESYEIRNNSDVPVYVDLSEVIVTETGGLTLVKDASLSTPGSSEYSLNLTIAYPSALTTNTVTGIVEGIFEEGTMQLAMLDGQYVKQPTPTAINGYITIGGYYAGILSSTSKNPKLIFDFTFSLEQ